ncbi:NirD/YgiW/YdeI family stress tolerance protein [Dongshaea marina]|uniref:NirD/YgiW/YdeI family stress tolerance protein n=1 Tax=Dongshaea marina TaxID=2047966 RepID=UPI000D3EDEF5|nr:NirD/YgiW/YdeI family stress tolerance protein [Dongshaea marina]
MKRTAWMLLLGAGLSFCAIASSPGGFKGPREQDTSFIQAWSRPITLQGHIQKQLGDSRYIFAADHGRFLVDIPKSLWKGHWITTSETIRLTGREIINWSSVEIQAESLEFISTRAKV